MVCTFLVRKTKEQSEALETRANVISPLKLLGQQQ